MSDHDEDWKERYDAKPLLVVVENYALEVIGALAPGKLSKTVTMVQGVFGGGEDWKATVRQVLHWDETIDDVILQNWWRYQQFIENSGQLGGASPIEFARMFGDKVVG
jgi:hypothetical protein